MELVIDRSINAFLTHGSLQSVNTHAIEKKKNMALEEDFVDSLDTNLVFPILSVFLHNGKEFRLQILFDEKGSTGQVDVDFDVLHEFIEYRSDASENEFYERILSHENEEIVKSNAHALAQYEGIVLMFDCVMRNKFVREYFHESA